MIEPFQIDENVNNENENSRVETKDIDKTKMIMEILEMKPMVFDALQYIVV